MNVQAGTIVSGSESIRLEPKVMELLKVLADASPGMVARDDLMAALWPDSVVGDDALARCVLKLRRALGDEAREARFVETLPKRGYRLLQPLRPIPESSGRKMGWVIAALIAGLTIFAVGIRSVIEPDGTASPTADPGDVVLLERAHDHYYQFTREGNEAAAELYRRLLARQPDLAAARAGMANVLAQRIIRWPEDGPEVPSDQASVAAALESDRLSTPWSRSTIARAVEHAEAAVAVDPNDPHHHKALGLALSLSGELERARAQYAKVLKLDPEMWEAWINLGELDSINNDLDAAIDSFIRAYEAMGKRYARDSQRIGRWQAELGTKIGDTFLAAGRIELAEQWYRRVLEHTPLHVDATLGLASVRNQMGDTKEAQSLCANLNLRVGPISRCGTFLPNQDEGQVPN